MTQLSMANTGKNASEEIKTTTKADSNCQPGLTMPVVSLGLALGECVQTPLQNGSTSSSAGQSDRADGDTHNHSSEPRDQLCERIPNMSDCESQDSSSNAYADPPTGDLDDMADDLSEISEV